MLYLIYSLDKPNNLEKRLAARPAHLARLEALKKEDRLVLAGPNPILDTEEANSAGFSGSTVIAEFNSLAEAQAWANDDPYVHADVYEHVTVKPFKRVF